MKKLLTIALLLGIISSTYSQNIYESDTIDRLYANNLTKFNTSASFRPSDTITRGEAAKFLVQYANLQKLEKVKATTECQFNDLRNYDTTLTPYIVEACEYGLFKGANGNYSPTNLISKGEAITVIVRSIQGIQNENFDPRYLLYYEKGSLMNISLGVMNSFDQPITRITLGLRLKQAYENKEENEKNEILNTENFIEVSNDSNIETLDDGTKVYKNSVCDHTYYRGPKGGCYYVNGNDVKIYDTSKVCCSNK